MDTSWFDNAVVSAVNAAHAKQMREGMSGWIEPLFLYYKRGGLMFAPDAPGQEWDLASGEIVRGFWTKPQLMTWTFRIARCLACLPEAA